MEVHVPNNKLREMLNSDKECQKRFGAPMAKKIKTRLVALKAANSLADFWPPKSPPERCHELVGDRVGTFSMDVMQPYRLLFTPTTREETENADEVPEDKKEDEKTRWSEIKEVDIQGIEDTHGR